MIRTALNAYRTLRHNPHMIYLPQEEFPYNLNDGEMNPIIFGGFFAEFYNGKRIFEPFANPDGRTFEAAESFEHDLVAHSIIAGHPNIVVADSTKTEPSGLFDGVLFHPPYYGSRLFTGEERELSNVTNLYDYRLLLENSAAICMSHLKADGRVCAVGRRYRHKGQEIKLDEWIVGAFGKRMIPVSIIISEPDIVIDFEFEKEV